MKNINKQKLARIIKEQVLKSKRKQKLRESVSGAVRKVLLNEKVDPSQSLDEAPVDDFLAKKDASLPDFVSTLKTVAGDDDFRAVAGGGKGDGNPNDEVVQIERTSVKAISLLPTQAEIGLDASLKDQMNNKYNAAEAALGIAGTPIIMPAPPPGPPPPILVFNGKFILDGHHRWSQVAMMNPDGEVAIDNMTSPAIKDNEQAIKVMQLAIAAKAGNVVTKPFEGSNLMKLSEEDIKNYVLKNIQDNVLQLLVQANKIESPDKQAAANYIGENFKLVARNPGPFSREKSMPQAGKSGVPQDDVNKALARGEINFLEPKKGDKPAASPGNRKEELVPESVKRKWGKLIK